MSKILPGLFLVLLALTACGAAFAGVFDLDEIQVTPSPPEIRMLEFKETDKVLDFDVARNGPAAAILVQGAAGDFKVLFWDIATPTPPSEWAAPKGFRPRSVAWHPLGGSLFLLGNQGAENVIARLEKGANGWTFRPVYKSPRELRRLVVGPRPYAVSYNSEEDKTTSAYRLFFGVKNADGTFAIRSVTEEGAIEYQAIGRKTGFTTFEDAGEQPSRLEARSALPLAFHPAGHILLWEDGEKSFHQALYRRDHWEKDAKLGLSGGTVTPTPNGLALIHWQPGVPGVAIVSDHGRKRDPQATEYTFTSTPSSVPDGRGIVGTIRMKKWNVLAYVPIRVPLADVANAWMFAQSSKDEDLLGEKRGLLRDLPGDQLYSLYESEAYQGYDYDPSTPTRPYLVTTDVFWELLAAAYEGLFIVAERQQAIPAFWKFVSEAGQSLRRSNPDSRWTSVFSVLLQLKNGPEKNGPAEDADGRNLKELALILEARGIADSPVLGEKADYGELKPRGHYESSEDMATYFKAFKYLTQLAGDVLLPEGEVPVPEEHLRFLEELNHLDPEARTAAKTWIETYGAFIAPSRSPLVPGEQTRPVPPYAKHPLNRPRIFPLAWGFDNEVLLSTVFHENWPAPERIEGPGGTRLIPSGLDVAAALGNSLAGGLLSPEILKYPPLRAVLENLRARWRANKADGKGRGNLYDRWMDALAVQWADGTAPPDAGAKDLWDAKRLQTGLASWATLRHATVLVNERTAAESGEGAFEPILLTPPRGYVEPDPGTFNALAGLFRSLQQVVESWATLPDGQIQTNDSGEREALKAGICRRLAETAAKAELFGRIAGRELAGERLTSEEYEEILYVGRVAEHHFLIFKSLASPDYALSNPDPMPKIADVSGGGPYRIPFLMAAVGRPMQWDQIVPYFGRSEIVKGAVYSYYEFVSESLMDDKEWIESLPSRRHPDWVSPFVSVVSGSTIPCSPRSPY